MSALKTFARTSRKNHRPRAAIWKNFARASASAHDKEILSELPRAIATSTIYRSMHLLEKGMVKRFDLGDGAARFELVGENDDGHHHHLVCTNCSSRGDRRMFS